MGDFVQGGIRVDEFGCVFRWDEQWQELAWCPLMSDGSLDSDSKGNPNWGCVDEELVGDEVTLYKGEMVTLSEVYRDIERLLGVKK